MFCKIGLLGLRYCPIDDITTILVHYLGTVLTVYPKKTQNNIWQFKNNFYHQVACGRSLIVINSCNKHDFLFDNSKIHANWWYKVELRNGIRSNYTPEMLVSKIASHFTRDALLIDENRRLLIAHLTPNINVHMEVLNGYYENIDSMYNINIKSYEKSEYRIFY